MAAVTTIMVRLEVLGQYWIGDDAHTPAVARNGAEGPGLRRDSFASTVVRLVWQLVLVLARARVLFLFAVSLALDRGVQTVLVEQQPTVAGLEVQEPDWHHP